MGIPGTTEGLDRAKLEATLRSYRYPYQLRQVTVDGFTIRGPQLYDRARSWGLSSFGYKCLADKRERAEDYGEARYLRAVAGALEYLGF